MSEEGRKVKLKKKKAGTALPATDNTTTDEPKTENAGPFRATGSGEAGDEMSEAGLQVRQTTLNGDVGEPSDTAGGDVETTSGERQQGPAPQSGGPAVPTGAESHVEPERSEGPAVPTADEPLVEPSLSDNLSGSKAGTAGPADQDEDVPMMEETESLAPEEAPASEDAGTTGSGMVETFVAEESGPRAESEESELQRLKKEFSDRLFELELEKNRMDELGSELAARSEELERRESEFVNRASALDEREGGLSERHSQVERREAELSGKGTQLKGRESELSLQSSALRKMEAELSKRHEMISAGTEAMNALSEELRQKELRVKQWEEERARARQELESLRAELDVRQERTKNEIATLEQDRQDVERLASEINARDGTLRQGEAEHQKKGELLEQARKGAEELDAGLKLRSAELQTRFDEVRSLEQHLSTIEEETRLCPHCGAIEEFAQLAHRSEQLMTKGGDTREINIHIGQARRAVREGDYEKAAASARRAADLIEQGERELKRREVMTRIVSSESLARMLSEAHAEVSGMETLLAEARALYNSETMDRALEVAEKARQAGLALERERFHAQDELAACGAVMAALKKTGVNLHEAERRKVEADRAMDAGDFKNARTLASETMALASEVAQSQDVAGVMSQVKLADETLDELRSLGLDVTEWERMVNRSRDFLKKLDFKSAEETARWARQKARDAGRQYRHALMAIDRSGSVISTYKDMGMIVKKAEDLQDEAKNRLKEGDADLAMNLARKGEKMVREIAERHKGAQAALRKAITTMRVERKSGRDITKGEKLYDLAQHQLELGEYANAMKLATKAAEAVTSASVALLELCPTCGEAIPENIPECPSCAEKKRMKKDAAEKGAELAQRSRLGSKGGRKYACPYCSELFEITVATRPITINCPWCGHDVSVVD
jgi:uncharacterized protein (DUF3084 family)